VIEIKSKEAAEDFVFPGDNNASPKVVLFPKPSHGNYLMRCGRDTKTAVIEVKFKDGATWTLRP
jgi:hypothetical protein